MRQSEKIDTARVFPDVSGMDEEARETALREAIEVREAALRAAMTESMDRFEETYRLLATEALSDDPAP